MVDGACARGVARCSSWWYGNEMLCGCKKREHCGGHKKKGNKCKVSNKTMKTKRRNKN